MANKAINVVLGALRSKSPTKPGARVIIIAEEGARDRLKVQARQSWTVVTTEGSKVTPIQMLNAQIKVLEASGNTEQALLVASYLRMLEIGELRVHKTERCAFYILPGHGKSFPLYTHIKESGVKELLELEVESV